MRLDGVGRLVRLAETDSTQLESRRLAEAGAAEGTLVWALRQRAGRGRLGRRWLSGEGGLYVTWILRPRFGPERLAELSLACGRAIAAALSSFGVETKVKRPNDVLALCPDGKWRKISGVLCEAAGDSRSLHWLLIGVGVNVNNDPPLKRATSLRALTGRRTPLEPVLRALLRELRAALRASRLS